MEDSTVPSVFDEMAESHFEYAGTGQRFANYLIDTVVCIAFNYATFFVITICMAFSGIDADGIITFFSNKPTIYGIAVLDMIIIYTVIEGITKGRSLGKLITRTRVVRGDYTSSITWKDAFIRTLYRIIPFEPFSAFGGYPWHDKFSKTYVIKKMRKV